MFSLKYVGRLYENTYRVNLHNHDFWEAVYYTKGSGTVEIGGEKYSFKAHDLFLLPPGVPHTDYAESGFQDIFFVVDDENLKMSHCLKLHDTESLDILSIMEQLYREFHMDRKNHQNILDSLYTVFYNYVLALSEDVVINSYVADIINDIVDNISNTEYKVQQTLAKIPFSDDYIRRLFFAETGKTIHQYLTMKRIDYAKKLLEVRRSSGLSIQEISWVSGFSDCFYFSRVFKKSTGVSPKDWK